MDNEAVTTALESGETTELPSPAADAGAQDSAPAAGADTDGAAPAAQADPSTAKQDTQGADAKPKTPFEAVKARYEATRPQAEKEAKGDAPKSTESPPADPSKSTDKPEAKTEAGKKDELLEPIAQEEWNRIPGKTRKRIEQFRAAIKERDSKLAEVEPHAKAYVGIAQYCSANKVTPENFRYAIGLMAAVNSDPQRAWTSLQPIISYLRQQVGEELPRDLQERVEKGELSQAAAQELVRTQGEATRTKQALAERETAEAQANERTQREAHAQRVIADVQTHLGAWEQQWKSSDPDYSKKMPHVWNRVDPELRAAAARGELLPAKAVIELADKARRDVEELLRQASPARPAMRTVTGGSSSKAAPAPKTHFEALKATYQAGRGA